ncbi:ATP-binding protein [Ferruginibacter paludis]|uniref:ATP-binding protein n=1 Tax=Ferruginibacter paludis TaxID=1310417 RepID=UPI0025B47735|nr:ATP-binding protein [Ferruginibacter paludis]MDN3657283.1 ATP-binding protein [Ferruginibacter paludis]
MIIFSIYRIKKVWVACILPCLLLSGFVCSAQNFEDKGYWLAANNRYNDLPVDSLWLFHPGNSLPATDSNNTGWQLVNTELLLDSTNKRLEKLGNGWYAKKITVPDQLRGKPVALRMWQFGASEIFMDGKLIKRYGMVGSEMKNEKIYVPRTPVIIDLDNQFYHQLLVHYSNFHAGNPGYANQHPGFRLLISPPWVEPASVLANTSSLPVSIGIIFIFCLYFFFVWIFYPKRLASLITMLLLLDFCVVLTSVYYLLSENEWAPLVRASNTGAITSAWLNFFVLLILYALYYQGKMPRRTWLVIAGMLVCVAGVIFTHFSFLSVIATLLCYVEIVRMFMLGFKNKATGFGLLLTGFLIQQAGFFLIVLDVFHWFPVYTPEVLLIQLIFPQLGIPLTYALHLAWEFRSANRDLRLKLIQVNQLSQKSLEQEQEKQQILAAQNETLEKQVGERTAALSQSLSELKSTQSQLIQSEKMASLGELTAGIAHEIQNPLNFVNNFSEVNKEMIDELQTELKSGNVDEAINISNDIKANEEKINHHGKRADAIVKGMLQHSRQTTGTKEPTDINALCDEYLRLSYHGLRAKDKSFNTTMSTAFDEGIGKINIIPQDIGRVLLNLFNNAFYAVTEKKLVADESYHPSVLVQTKKANGGFTISISDNGNGIPKNIIDKIFQPFFTTKPTGQGTGLGLSLAYDIVKAHGGELKVETTEGNGSKFIIQLPN